MINLKIKYFVNDKNHEKTNHFNPMIFIEFILYSTKPRTYTVLFTS